MTRANTYTLYREGKENAKGIFDAYTSDLMEAYKRSESWDSLMFMFYVGYACGKRHTLAKNVCIPKRLKKARRKRA